MVGRRRGGSSHPMSGHIRVDVLDVVGVVNGDLAVTGRGLGGRRARVALVALALAGRQLSADRLASIIWADGLPATWRVALRGVIRGLRTACAPLGGGEQQLIGTTPAGYRVASGVETDVDVAAEALRQASDLIAQGRHQAAIALAEPISRMAGSQLLPGEDADWIYPHRRAVDGLGLRGLELVVAAAGALGEHDRAIAAARRFVSNDPLDERAHRALIGALDRSGDRAGAVRAFERCRVVLGDQLGIDPSAQTVEVYVAALGEQARGSPARLPSITSTFVGREEELARLDEVLARPGVVTVAGRGASANRGWPRERRRWATSTAVVSGSRSLRSRRTPWSPLPSLSRSAWRSAPTTLAPRSPSTSLHSAVYCSS